MSQRNYCIQLLSPSQKFSPKSYRSCVSILFILALITHSDKPLMPLYIHHLEWALSLCVHSFVKSSYFCLVKHAQVLCSCGFKLKCKHDSEIYIDTFSTKWKKSFACDIERFFKYIIPQKGHLIFKRHVIKFILYPWIDKSLGRKKTWKFSQTTICKWLPTLKTQEEHNM